MAIYRFIKNCTKAYFGIVKPTLIVVTAVATQNLSLLSASLLLPFFLGADNFMILIAHIHKSLTRRTLCIHSRTQIMRFTGTVKKSAFIGAPNRRPRRIPRRQHIYNSIEQISEQMPRKKEEIHAQRINLNQANWTHVSLESTYVPRASPEHSRMAFSFRAGVLGLRWVLRGRDGSAEPSEGPRRICMGGGAEGGGGGPAPRQMGLQSSTACPRDRASWPPEACSCCRCCWR